LQLGLTVLLGTHSWDREGEGRDEKGGNGRGEYNRGEKEGERGR